MTTTMSHNEAVERPQLEQKFVDALAASLEGPMERPTEPARWVILALLVARPEEGGAMRPQLVVFEPRAGWRSRLLPLSTVESTERPMADPYTFVAADWGDLEGQGELSLVAGVTRESGRCSLLQFRLDSLDAGPETLAGLGEGASFLRSVSLGDVDGDGADEIVLGTRPNGQVLLVEPAKHRAATLIDEANYGQQSTNTREVLVTDVDGDGRSEILAATARADTGKWESTPGGLFLYSRPRDAWTKRVVDDFEGRSHSRMMVVGTPGAETQPVIIANRVGILEPNRQIIDPYSELYSYRVSDTGVERRFLTRLDGAIKSRGFALGDIDGDGDDELVVGTRTLDVPGHGETALVFLKWDRARQSWLRETLAKSGPVGFHCVAVADIDGDGKAEIIASDDETGCVHLYHRRGAGWHRWPLVETAHRLFVVNIHVVGA